MPDRCGPRSPNRHFCLELLVPVHQTNVLSNACAEDFWRSLHRIVALSCFTLTLLAAIALVNRPVTAQEAPNNGGVGNDVGRAPGAPPTQKKGEPGQDRKPKNALQFTFEALGWEYSITFLGLSFTLVALFIMNVLASRRDAICPPQLIASFEQQLDAKQFQAAFDLAKSDESFLGRVLAAGMAKLNSGYDKAIHAMQETGEDENMKLEHRLSYMALIGTLSPMVGLLGTVDGMVRSFTVIANSPASPKPSELAHGISTALITTLAGLLIAIPALAAFNILKNRVARLVFEVGMAGEDLMSRFEGAAPKKT